MKLLEKVFFFFFFKFSKLFIDIAKIVLTGVVIGGMSPIFTRSSVGVNYIVIVIGIMISVMSAWLGCRILKP